MATSTGSISIPLGHGNSSVTLVNPSQFASEFLKGFLLRGLGSASKKDVDLLVVHLLINQGALATRPLHEVSLLLQIPETRLSGLIYEAKLRFAVVQVGELRSAVLARLAAASFDYDHGWVMFEIEDRMIRQAFAAEMKQIGHFADGSFSREVVRVKQESFQALLDKRFLNKSEKAEVVTSVTAALSASDAFLNKITFRKIMTKFVEGAAEQTGQLGVSTVVAALTGGVSLPVTLTSAVTNFFKQGLHKKDESKTLA